MPARSLPPELFPYFSAAWSPWGKQRPVPAFLNAVRNARASLNGVFDFSARPCASPVSLEARLNGFQGTLLEGWHKLHADRWEQSLERIEQGGRRPLRMHTVWFDWIRALKAEGLRLDIRRAPQDAGDSQAGRPVWFDDVDERPRLTRFWLEEGVDPAMTYSPMAWSVWLGIENMPAGMVNTLLGHGLAPDFPIVAAAVRSPYLALGSLGETAASTADEVPGFWSSADPRATRWHEVALLLADATPDLSALAIDDRSAQAVIRRSFPTVWAVLEQRALMAVAGEGPDISTRAPGRARL